jgi:hypothetical protein
MWTKLDMTTYRLMMGDVPTNAVSDKLGMSGECLCGAYAKTGELDNIRAHYPDVAAEIDQLEQFVRDSGAPAEYCTWGHGLAMTAPATATPGGIGLEHKTGPMCTSCHIGTDPLWELIEKESSN